MRAPISVIIPTLNAAEFLPACLESLVEGLERGLIRELIVSAAYFLLRVDRGGACVARWANLRARWGLPYGDQGLLIPAPLYQRCGGYQDIPLMEDVAMARALRGQLTGLDAEAVTSAAKYRQQGWLRRGARNLWTLARYFAGVDPAVLAKGYRRVR